MARNLELSRITIEPGFLGYSDLMELANGFVPNHPDRPISGQVSCIAHFGETVFARRELDEIVAECERRQSNPDGLEIVIDWGVHYEDGKTVDDMMTVRFGTMPLDTTVANDITYTAAYQADAELIQEFYDSGGGAFGIHLLTRTRDGSPLGRATVPEKYVDWQSMLDAVTAVPTGAEHAKEYEDKVEELLTALFSPSLADPDPQSQLYGGRQIVDIVYTNVDTEGFFGWIVSHAKLRAPRIIVELKNYGGDPKNPEFDQIKGRMNNTIGQLGFLVYRQTTDWKGVLDRAQIAHKGEKFVLPLDDSFLAKLVDARIAGQDISPILRNLYTKVVSG